MSATVPLGYEEMLTELKLSVDAEARLAKKSAAASGNRRRMVTCKRPIRLDNG